MPLGEWGEGAEVWVDAPTARWGAGGDDDFLDDDDDHYDVNDEDIDKDDDYDDDDDEDGGNVMVMVWKLNFPDDVWKLRLKQSVGIIFTQSMM